MQDRSLTGTVLPVRKGRSRRGQGRNHFHSICCCPLSAATPHPTPSPSPGGVRENSQQGWLFSPTGSQGYKNKSCHFLSPCSAVCAWTPSDENVVLFMTLEGIKIQISSAFYHWNWSSHFTALSMCFVSFMSVRNKVPGCCPHLGLEKNTVTNPFLGLLTVQVCMCVRVCVQRCS